MLTKYTAAGLAGSLLLASAAFAQSPAQTPAKTPATTSDHADVLSQSSVQGDWRASKLTGLSVYNDKNENIGSISDLLTDKTGTIKAAVISVGGFLGVGARLVAVPFDKMKFVNEPIHTASAASPGRTGGASSMGGARPPTTTGSAASAPKANPWYPDHATFNATKDELQKMPEFKYSTK